MKSGIENSKSLFLFRITFPARRLLYVYINIWIIILNFSEECYSNIDWIILSLQISFGYTAISIKLILPVSELAPPLVGAAA